MLLGLFPGRGPANARALVRIDEDAGHRPAPMLAGCISDLFFKRADAGVPAHHGKIVIAPLPENAGMRIGGSSEMKRLCPSLRLWPLGKAARAG